MAEREVQLRLTETGYDEIAEKLDELKQKIDELIEKFDELGKKIETPEIRLEGADQVQESLQGISDELDEVDASFEEFEEKLDATGAKAEETDAALDGLSASASELASITEGGSDAQVQFAEAVRNVNVVIEKLSIWLDEVAASMADDDASASDLADNFGGLEQVVKGLGSRTRELGVALDAVASEMVLEAAAAEGLVAPIEEAAEATDNLRDKQAEAADTAAANAGAQATVGSSALLSAGKIELLDKAMSSARDKASQLALAGQFLNLDLAETDELAERAAASLRKLGFSEVEAAAGASALASAQAALDASLAKSGGSGGISGIIESLFGKTNGLGGMLGVTGSFAGGIAASFGIAAVMAEIGALVTGFSAALMGIVPAVILAIPSIERLDAAFKDNRKELAKQPEAVQEIVHDLRSLKSEYDSMAKAFEPDVFGIISRGLTAAKELLPTFQPLADQAAGGIDNLLNSLDRFFKPAGAKPSGLLALHNPAQDVAPQLTQFQQWLAKVSPDIKAGIEGIGKTIGTIAVDWGKFMTRFSPKDIQNAFHILDNLINWWGTFWGNMISHVMNMWDDLSAAFKNTKNWYNDVEQWTTQFSEWVGGKISNLVSTVRRNWDDANQATEHSWLSIGHTVEHATDSVRETVISAGHFVEAAWDSSVSRVVSYTDRLPSEVMHALASLPGDMLHMGENTSTA